MFNVVRERTNCLKIPDSNNQNLKSQSFCSDPRIRPPYRPHSKKFHGQYSNKTDTQDDRLPHCVKSDGTSYREAVGLIGLQQRFVCSHCER